MQATNPPHRVSDLYTRHGEFSLAWWQRRQMLAPMLRQWARSVRMRGVYWVFGGPLIVHYGYMRSPAASLCDEVSGEFFGDVFQLCLRTGMAGEVHLRGKFVFYNCTGLSALAIFFGLTKEELATLCEVPRSKNDLLRRIVAARRALESDPMLPVLGTAFRHVESV